MSIAACLSTGKDDHETPDEFYERYYRTYDFLLDAAANETNHKCDLWFGPGGVAEDALTADWTPFLEQGNVWMNPPYSRNLQTLFVQKAIAASQLATRYQVVCLLPSRTDTALFHDFIVPNVVKPVEFLRGRLKFKHTAASAPFPSMVVVF